MFLIWTLQRLKGVNCTEVHRTTPYRIVPHRTASYCTPYHGRGAAQLIQDEGQVAVLVLCRYKKVLLPQGVHRAVPAGNLDLRRIVEIKRTSGTSVVAV